MSLRKETKQLTPSLPLANIPRNDGPKSAPSKPQPPTTFPPLQPNTARVSQAAHKSDPMYIPPPNSKRVYRSRHPTFLGGLPRGEGFEKLHHSLHTVVQRLPGTLENKWDLIADYLDGYFNDEDSANAARILQQMYDRVAEQTAKLDEPNEPKTALACVFLDQILHFFSKFLPDMKGICKITRDELLKAIFPHVPDTEPRPLEHSDLRTGQDVTDVLSSWYMVGTWAEQAKQNEKIINAFRSEETNQSNTILELHSTMQYWKDAYLRKVFTGWRAYTSHEKTSRQDQFKAQRTIEELQAQLDDLLEEKKKMVEYTTHIAELQQEVNQLKSDNGELQTQVKSMNEKETQMLKEINEQALSTKQMQLQMATESEKAGHLEYLRAEMRALEAQYDRLSDILQDFVGRMDGATIRQRLKDLGVRVPGLDGSKDASTVTGGGTVSAYTVIDWANAVLTHHPAGRQRLLTELGNGVRCLESYLCLVNSLDPTGALSDDALKRALDNDAADFKATTFLRALDRMGVPQHCTHRELTHASSEPPHVMLLAELFLRYADATTSEKSSKPGSFVGNGSATQTLAQLVGDEPPPLMGEIGGSTWNRSDSLHYGMPKSPSSGAPNSQSPKAQLQMSTLNKKEPKKAMKPEEWKTHLDTVFKDNSKWKRAGWSVFQQCADLLLDRIRGNRRVLLSDQKQAVLNFGNLRDILSSDDDKAAEQLEALQMVIDTHLPLLRNVYKFYGQSDSNALNVLMSDHEFWRFCADAKIPDKSLSRHDLRVIFYSVNGEGTHHKEEENANKRGASPGAALQEDGVTTLTLQEWIESLVRIANVKYEKKWDEIAERLNYCIENDVIENCNHVEVDEFKEMVYRPKVQQVLKSYKKYLYDIFKHYSQRDNKFSKVLELNFHNFKRFLEECNLIDEVFTHYAIQHIFTKVQDDDDLSLTMTFSEFQMGIVATATFKNPAPYLPLNQRLQTFLDVLLLPRMQYKFNWRRPSVSKQ